jgi:hypothetical protein
VFDLETETIDSNDIRGTERQVRTHQQACSPGAVDRRDQRVIAWPARCQQSPLCQSEPNCAAATSVPEGAFVGTNVAGVLSIRPFKRRDADNLFLPRLERSNAAYPESMIELGWSKQPMDAIVIGG